MIISYNKSTNAILVAPLYVMANFRNDYAWCDNFMIEYCSINYFDTRYLASIAVKVPNIATPITIFVFETGSR